MPHSIVSREQWLEARVAFLAEEKEFNQVRDALSAKRRQLPWVKVETNYVFDTPDGEQSLVQLFGKKSQLIVQHFMFGTDWEEGCPSCSFWADGYNGFTMHVEQRDAAFVTVSKASLPTLEAYKKRMGWAFPWVSSANNSFNEYFQVSFSPEQMEDGSGTYNYRPSKFPSSEAPGVSVFTKGDNDEIYHTYSTYSRGLDMLNGAYHYMDLLPRGRDEKGLEHSMAWLKRHDVYE